YDARLRKLESRDIARAVPRTPPKARIMRRRWEGRWARGVPSRGRVPPGMAAHEPTGTCLRRASRRDTSSPSAVRHYPRRRLVLVASLLRPLVTRRLDIAAQLNVPLVARVLEDVV